MCYKSGFSSLSELMAQTRNRQQTFKSRNHPLIEQFVLLMYVDGTKLPERTEDLAVLQKAQGVIKGLESLFNEFMNGHVTELSDYTGDEKDVILVRLISQSVVKDGLSGVMESVLQFMPYSEVSAIQSAIKEIVNKFTGLKRQWYYCPEDHYYNLLFDILDIMTAILFFISKLYDDHLNRYK